MDSAEMRKELYKIKGLGEVTINRIVDHFEKQKFVNPCDEYCYSWDGENYSNGVFKTEEEAIATAKVDDPNAEEVWVGIAVKPKLRWFSNEEQIIDSMIDNLREDCGEYAEDGLDITSEQEVELGKMLDKAVEEWIDKYHIKPSCFTVIDCGLHVLKDN